MLHIVVLLIVVNTVQVNSEGNLGAIEHCNKWRYCNDGMHCCNSYFCCPNGRVCCYVLGLSCCVPKKPDELRSSLKPRLYEEYATRPVLSVLNDASPVTTY